MNMNTSKYIRRKGSRMRTDTNNRQQREYKIYKQLQQYKRTPSTNKMKQNE